MHYLMQKNTYKRIKKFPYEENPKKQYLQNGLVTEVLIFLWS